MAAAAAILMSRCASGHRFVHSGGIRLGEHVPPADRAAVFVSNQWQAEPCTEQHAVDLSTCCSPAAREKPLISRQESDDPGQRRFFLWAFPFPQNLILLPA